MATEADNTSSRRNNRNRRNGRDEPISASNAPHRVFSANAQPSHNSTSSPTPRHSDMTVALLPRTSTTPDMPKPTSIFESMLTKNVPPSQGVLKRFNEAPVYGNSTFTVIVGGEENPTSYSLHEALARKESRFIEAAFRKGWQESEDRIINLPDHEPEHFQLFFLFIYARSIFSAKDHDSVGLIGVDKEWTRLIDTWALGNYLQAVDFKDAVIDAIIQKVVQSGALVPQNMHQIVYPKSTSGTLIRRLTVDVAAHRWDTVYLRLQKNDPAWSDFFLDLSIALSNLKSTADTVKPVFETDPCAYHEHRIFGGPCYKTNPQPNSDHIQYLKKAFRIGASERDDYVRAERSRPSKGMKPLVRIYRILQKVACERIAA